VNKKFQPPKTKQPVKPSKRSGSGTWKPVKASDKMLTNKKFKDFFNKNVGAL
jgi:hypothetical protein